MFEPADQIRVWTTSVPFTYIIDYAPDHIGNDSYIEKVAEAPPTLLHVGHDVPFKSMYGPSDESDCLTRRLLTPREMHERIDVLKSYVSQLHDAGVTLVIPYICSMFMFGDAKRREGFWRFYDKWERYSEFGFGSRPRSDPVSWSYERPRPLGFDHVKNLDGRYVYEPCINHPDWRRFLRTVVANIAQVGYDGVFVDVNASACPKVHCRNLFRRYLEARYTRKDLERLFGFATPSKVRLGRRGEGLLWVETLRFRGERMADLFQELRNEGRKFRDTFVVIPNLSPFQHVHGVWKRVGISHVFSSWARECPIIMFEEMHQPGLFDEGVVSNFMFQYKYAFANTARAGCLLYNSQDVYGVGISIAEAAAGGGGAFIQGGYSCPGLRRRYREFFSKSPDLFEGMRPHSSVGLVFFYDQLAWGTRSHMENSYRIAEELMARHVLFDLIVERNFRLGVLRNYRVIIACDMENASEIVAASVLEYVRSGGILVAIGRFGTSDDRGKRRRGGILGSIPEGGWERLGEGVRSAHLGQGRCLQVDRLDLLLSPSPFELFMISEDDSLKTERIFELIAASKGEVRERNRELIPSMEKAVGQMGISDCEETLRFNAYRNVRGSPGRMTLHSINYNIPIRGAGVSGPPVPTEPKVRLEIPHGWEVDRVDVYSPPDAECRELDYHQNGRSLTLDLPPMDIYQIARIASKA